ncbi:hypothetical protein FHS85_000879 [Rhodoligotrophos appendicifer]|uniref:DUF2934 domain-containing protein n=1 Tax=Rhodoligotrophos appendicifer TaxID=987056 RepID=UPI00117FDADE|nr:DUF2934 domain-containing protein [Rhodoligotrophos appendicifer]
MHEDKRDAVRYRQMARKYREMALRTTDERALEAMERLSEECLEHAADIERVLDEKEREKTLRIIAHRIWEAEGRPEGRATHHWRQAIEIYERGEYSTAPKHAADPTRSMTRTRGLL